MLIKTISTLLLALCISANAFAGDFGAGNGGDGVVENGKVYLFDLYESGVTNPNLSRDSVENSRDLAILDKVFSSMNNEVKNIIARKISAIRYIDPVLAESLLLAFQQYSWKIVQLPLNNVKDDDGTDIDYPIQNLVQVAVRNNRTIRISNSYMSKMDAGNLAALIFHEVIYALIPPEYRFGRRLSEVIIESDGSKREIYEKYKFLRQPSRPVRDIVAFLFSDDFVSNPSTLLRVSKGYLPMYSNKNRSRAKGKNLFYFEENMFLTNPKLIIHPRTYKSRNIEFKKDANDSEYMNSLLQEVCTGKEYIRISYKYGRFAFYFRDFIGENSTKHTYLQISTDTYFYKYDQYFQLRDKFYQNSFHSSSDMHTREENLKKCKHEIRQEVLKFFSFFEEII